MLSRKDLISIPVPSETKTYKPISNALIFRTVDSLCSTYNFNIDHEILEAKRGGNQQKMRFVIGSSDPDFGFEVAVMNSYDKTLSLRTGAGATAYICWNLMVMAPYKLQEKHTGNVEEDMLEFFDSIFQMKGNQIKNANILNKAFEQVHLTELDMAHLAGELFFKENLINTEQANILKKQIEKPSFDYKNDPESLLALYNHATYAIQTEHPMTFLQTQLGVQDFFIEQFETVTSNKLVLN